MSKMQFEVSSRNVFKDLGLTNAEEHLVKAQLVYELDKALRNRKLNRVAAGELFRIPQRDVSKVLRGEFRQLPIHRLLGFLATLNPGIEIVVRPHRGQSAKAATHVF